MRLLLTLLGLCLSTMLFSQITKLDALPNYSWTNSLEPKTFAKKLQFSFVSAAKGFPSYGTVLAGGSYSTVQDGGNFQFFFPYGVSHGGIAPKVRLGKYNNQGWSDWETLFTSANANDLTIDWKSRKLLVGDKIGVNDSNPITKLDLGNQYSDPGTFPNKIALWYGGSNNYMGFGVSGGDLDYFSQSNHRFYTGFNGTPGTEKLVIQSNGNVGIGTNDANGWKLAVNGKIRAKEIKVETAWADFVFEKEYKLPSLDEVDTFIKNHGHLQDIPSAKEVSENGILLGEMNSKLLQKIEELMLYTIEQQKELEFLKKEVIKLKSN